MRNFKRLVLVMAVLLGHGALAGASTQDLEGLLQQAHEQAAQWQADAQLVAITAMVNADGKVLLQSGSPPTFTFASRKADAQLYVTINAEGRPVATPAAVPVGSLEESPDQIRPLSDALAAAREDGVKIQGPVLATLMAQGAGYHWMLADTSTGQVRYVGATGKASQTPPPAAESGDGASTSAQPAEGEARPTHDAGSGRNNELRLIREFPLRADGGYVHGRGNRAGPFAFSPDGLLCVAGKHIIDIKAGKRLNDIKTPGRVSAAAFAPDGRVLVLGLVEDGWAMRAGHKPHFERQRLVLYDLEQGKEAAELAAHEQDHDPQGSSPPERNVYLSMDIAPDGKSLATLTGKGELAVWDLSQKKQVATLATLAAPPRDAGLVLRISPDGRQLAVLDEAREAVAVWSLADRKQLTELQAPRLMPVDIRWTSDSRIAAGGTDGLALFELPTGKVTRLSGVRGAVSSMAVSADGRWLASDHSGVGVVLWDLADPSVAAELKPPALAGNAGALHFGADGRSLLTMGRSAQVWALPGVAGVDDAQTASGHATPAVMTAQQQLAQQLQQKLKDGLGAAADGIEIQVLDDKTVRLTGHVASTEDRAAAERLVASGTARGLPGKSRPIRRQVINEIQVRPQ